MNIGRNAITQIQSTLISTTWIFQLAYESQRNVRPIRLTFQRRPKYRNIYNCLHFYQCLRIIFEIKFLDLFIYLLYEFCCERKLAEFRMAAKMSGIAYAQLIVDRLYRHLVEHEVHNVQHTCRGYNMEIDIEATRTELTITFVYSQKRKSTSFPSSPPPPAKFHKREEKTSTSN